MESSNAVSRHRIVRCLRAMKEHADYEVFCAEQAHFHYGDPFTRRDVIYYWLRGTSGGSVKYFQDKICSIYSLLKAINKTFKKPQISLKLAKLDF